MQAVDIITKVESFIISIPREVPYLGPLREGGWPKVSKGSNSLQPCRMTA